MEYNRGGGGIKITRISKNAIRLARRDKGEGMHVLGDVSKRVTRLGRASGQKLIGFSRRVLLI